MYDKKQKNRLKTILKLIVVIPLFSFLGMYIGKMYINGNYYSILILTLICFISGKILTKI
jgi:hypothetical protein